MGTLTQALEAGVHWHDQDGGHMEGRTGVAGPEEMGVGTGNAAV